MRLEPGRFCKVSRGLTNILIDPIQKPCQTEVLELRNLTDTQEELLLNLRAYGRRPVWLQRGVNADPVLCSSCIGLGFLFCYALPGKAAYDLNASH